MAIPSASSLLLALVLGGCAVLFVFPLASRSLTMADEGYMLLQALDLANGKILYRDMDAFVTPGMWFLLAAVFKLFEPSVIVSRLPVVIGYVVLIGLAYRIPTYIGGWRAGLAGVAVMMMTTVWAFPAWTFAFYSPFSVLFALAGLERLLAFHTSSARRDLLLASLLFGLSVLFKQNYGALALIGAGLSLIAFRVEVRGVCAKALGEATRDVLWLASGVAAIALLTIGYFASHDALSVMYQSLVVHPFEFSGKHDISYLGLGRLFAPDLMSDHVEMMTYGAQPIYRAPIQSIFTASTRVVERMHVLLYWFPPLIFIMGATLSLGGDSRVRNEDKGESSAKIDTPLLSILLVSFFIFLGTFPRADFNHLINVYQPVVIAGVASFAVFFRARTGSSRIVRGVAGIAVTLVLGCYLLISGYWYYGLVWSMNMEVEGSRGGVKIGFAEASSLRRVLQDIDQFSKPGDAMLTVPDIAMLNFLSKRPMPSAYYNLYEHHIAHDAGAGVAAGAMEHDTTVAVTRVNNFFSDRVGLKDYAPELADYIDRYFEHRYTVGREEYLIYSRRDEALPERDVVSALEDCEFNSSKIKVVDHLLFRSMYQTIGPGHLHNEESLVARCTVDVPKQGADLVFELGYSHPRVLNKPTTLRVDVFIDAKSLRNRVFTETMRVTTTSPRTNRIPAPRVQQVDLSDYAGQRIKLHLRTVRKGKVTMSRSKVRGFGTTWQNPRIIARAATDL